ncbi:MAG: metallophosphoesterase family protein [Chthoniobacterales bacterium]
MRIAALYDIHGNLPALEAVLHEIRSEKVDRIVIGGDVIPGAFPRETLERLLELDFETNFILGNGEVAVLQTLAGEIPDRVPEAFRPVITWTGLQLKSGQADIIRKWPKTIWLDVLPLGRFLFCHATPRNEHEIFTKLTTAERLDPVFQGVAADVVVCGHTHMQFERTVAGVRVVNAGSVGMPFGNTGAHWLLIGPDIQFRHTAYDVTAAARQIRGSSYPQAEHFAANNVLNPPSEQQMLELFSKSELS